MTVGERIRQRRLELGLTQDELAKLMGYNGRSGVCAAETKGDNITTTKVEKYAKALGVSSRYLMGYEEDIAINPEDSNSKTIKRAMELYKMYASADPEVQSAIELLLKTAQRKK